MNCGGAIKLSPRGMIAYGTAGMGVDVGSGVSVGTGVEVGGTGVLLGTVVAVNGIAVSVSGSVGYGVPVMPGKPVGNGVRVAVPQRFERMGQGVQGGVARDGRRHHRCRWG